MGAYLIVRNSSCSFDADPHVDVDVDVDVDVADNVEDDVEEVDVIALQHFSRIRYRINSVRQGARILDLQQDDWSMGPRLTSCLIKFLLQVLSNIDEGRGRVPLSTSQRRRRAGTPLPCSSKYWISCEFCLNYPPRVTTTTCSCYQHIEDAEHVSEQSL
jgi:hypothetical protein